jgi:hypothetical protein
MEVKRAWDRAIGDMRWISLHFFEAIDLHDTCVITFPRATVAATAEPKQHKPRKSKQKADNMSNAEWGRDIHRRRDETQGRKDWLEKLQLRPADAAAEAE